MKKSFPISLYICLELKVYTILDNHIIYYGKVINTYSKAENSSYTS